MEEYNKILIFDSSCVLCNTAVKFVFNRNNKRDIFFTHFESSYFRKFLKSKIEADTDSVVFLNNQKVSIKSDAVIEILSELNSPIKYLKFFRFIPKPLRDYCYDIIARFRYKIFGKIDSCYYNPELNKQILP